MSRQTQSAPVPLLHAALDISGNVHFHTCYKSPVNLVPVQQTDSEYKQLAQKFYEQWKHAKPRPTIRSIFYVAYSGEGLNHMARFSEYCNKVGNVQLFFHGTRRGCRIAENDQSITCCTQTNCNLCCILKGSYSIDMTKKNSMFGAGVYTSLVSSKADGYCKNVDRMLSTKVMIVNHVALGNTKIAKAADHDMMHAGALYNSVTAATTNEGGQVLYHEAVVYREDAICANAIIVYQ